MKVLISNDNKDLINKLANKKLKFSPNTKNTSTFTITEHKFNQLVRECRLFRINPYALFYW